MEVLVNKMRFITQQNAIKLFVSNAFQLVPIINENIFRFDGTKTDILLQINLDRDEVHRSILNKDGSCLFILDIDFHEYSLLEGLKLALHKAKQIEKDFSGEFLWTFSGRGIKGFSMILQTPKNINYINRFGNIWRFYKLIINYFEKKYDFELDKTFVNLQGLTRSIGSLNNKSGFYMIPIKLDWDVLKILDYSLNKKIISWKIPELPVQYWRYILNVYEEKSEKFDWFGRKNKVEVNFAKYPPCIQNLMQKPKKGNKDRFDLLRYFYYLHSRSDVDHIMKQILTNTEYRHMKKEGQDKYVFSVGYPPPTCKHMQRRGFCNGCKRKNPTILEEDKND